MTKVIAIKDWIPEFNYKEPKIPEKRCGTCKHGMVTNPGASHPGFACSLMYKEEQKKDLPEWEGKENLLYQHQVDLLYGICDNYKKGVPHRPCSHNWERRDKDTFTYTCRYCNETM